MPSEQPELRILWITFIWQWVHWVK